MSDQESMNSVEINPNRLSISSSNGTRDDMYSLDYLYQSDLDNHSDEDIGNSTQEIKQQDSIIMNDDNDTSIVILNPSSERGMTCRLVDYDDTESEIENNEKNDEVSQDSHRTSINEESKTAADLPIALRRSKRGHRTFMTELSLDSSSTSDSYSQVRMKSSHGNYQYY